MPLPYTVPISATVGALLLMLHFPFFGPLLYVEPMKPKDSVSLMVP